MASDLILTYWDSCVFIDGLRKTEARWPQIKILENQAKGGESVIYTSALAIAEVVKLQEFGELTEDESRRIAGYFRHKFIRVIPVDRVVTTIE